MTMAHAAIITGDVAIHVNITQHFVLLNRRSSASTCHKYPTDSYRYLYINLRRSRDCLCVSVAPALFCPAFVCVIALLHLVILGTCYAVHINASSL